MATYLVTGAAGFIGARLCESLLTFGHTVIGVDNLSAYYDPKLKDYRLGRLLNYSAWLSAAPGTSCFRSASDWTNGKFLFRQLDIEDTTSLDKLFQDFRFDAVFNLAARAGIRASVEDPHAYLSSNTVGVLNVLECQKRYGVKKHVMASTSSIYAGSPLPFTEESPVNTPLSPYAVAKKAAELMAHSYHKMYGLDVSILRFFTVFGPAGRPDMAIFRFVKWVADKTPIEIYGDGTQARDFTYVDDIVSGTIAAVKPLGYQIINLGGGKEPVSMREIIRMIEAASRQDASVTYNRRAIADMDETWAQISKAKLLLEWEPATSILQGISKTVAWHAENSDWLRTIKI